MHAFINDEVPKLYDLLKIKEQFTCVPPICKNSFLMGAETYIDSGNNLNAICCLIEALNVGLEKFKHGSIFADIEHLFVTQFSGIPRKEATETVVQPDSFYHQTLVQQLDELPVEWTVLQITKRHNPRVFMLRYHEIVSQDTGYFITLLRYPRMNLNSNQPILIAVDAEPSTFYKDLYTIVCNLRDNLKFDKANDTQEARRQYHAKLTENDETLAKRIEEMQRHFSAWLFLFAGEFTDPLSRTRESLVFKQVDDFCTVHRRSTQDRILLSLIARRIDLMQGEGIYRFCCNMEKDMEKVKILYIFLFNLKKTELKPTEFPLPCLLIVDEYMDQIFWEMLNDEQGICRLSNFEILRKLLQRYRNDIHNGYLELKTETGYSIINPANDLPAMEKRIMEFSEQCLPSTYKTIVGQTPNAEDLATSLPSIDVFLYFGHGNGLQFVKSDPFSLENMKAVTFLFGCNSVQLSSNGMWSEMKGAHMYYHMALCPAVLGMLMVVTDYDADCTAAAVLSRWIQCKGKVSWKDATKESWTAVASKKRTHEEMLEHASAPESNLLKIMCDFRVDGRKLFPLRHLISPCIRGLPVRAIN